MATIDKELKRGITLILIGILIPLIALPFVSGFSKDKSFYDNFYSAGIEISKDKAETVSSSDKVEEKPKTKSLDFSRFIPRSIPFRFFLAIMVVFIYIGIIKIDSWRRKKKSQQNQELK